MSSKNQPAFPTDQIESHHLPEFTLQGGLTKREYFAIRALQSIIIKGIEFSLESSTSQAIRYADALLEALGTDGVGGGNGTNGGDSTGAVGGSK